MVVITQTILHPFLDVIVVKYVQYIPKHCNKNQSQHDLHRRPIHTTYSNNYYIIDEILRQDQNEYKRNTNT